jgi:hypothetical protein
MAREVGNVANLAHMLVVRFVRCVRPAGNSILDESQHINTIILLHDFETG